MLLTSLLEKRSVAELNEYGLIFKFARFNIQQDSNPQPLTRKRTHNYLATDLKGHFG